MTVRVNLWPLVNYKRAGRPGGVSVESGGGGHLMSCEDVETVV